MEFESLVWTLKRLCFLGFWNLNLFRVLAFCFTWRGRSTNRFAVRFALLFHVERSLNKPLCGSLRFRVSVLQNDSTAHLPSADSLGLQQLKGGSFGFLRCFKWLYRTLPVVFRFLICLPIISDLQGHRLQKDSGKKLWKKYYKKILWKKL